MPTAVTERVPVTNQLLAALSRADLRHLNAGLEPVKLSFGEILHEPGESIEHVYFPNDSLVSLLTLVDRRHVLEVGLVGHEGMVGMALALGVEETPVRALVQAGGTAMRMRAAAFRREFSRCAPLQRGVHRYAHALMAQVAQTAACNRFHRVEARLARWLMMTRERIGSDHFRLTQAFLGHMLGVRRAGVTEAASALRKLKLIDYSRGYIAVIDARGLHAAACSCYEQMKERKGAN